MGELDVSQMFYTNLLLLGFDPSAMEAKHGLAFNKSIFSVPNRKAFELVTYFLFSRLDVSRCKKEFRDCWPVMEKKDPQTFRKVCQNWLQQISKEDTGTRLPPATPALLMTPGGEKFVKFLYCFSRYVLQQVAVNDYGADKSLFFCPEINPRVGCSSSTAVHTIHVETCRQRQIFLEGNRKREAIRKEWSKYTGELIMKYRQDIKLLKDCEVKLKNEQEKLENSPTAALSVSRDRRSGGSGRVSVGKTAADIKSVERMWRRIDVACETLMKDQKVLDVVLNEASDECCVDSSKLDIRIPELLIQQCHEELQRKNVDSLHTGGKVNLLNIIHLWNSALQLYLNKLHEAGLPDMTKQLPQVETSLQKHQSRCMESEKLRLHLEFEFLPQLKKSVEALRQELDERVSSTSVSHSSSHLQVPGAAALLPPTPPVSFEPADSPAAAELSRRYMLSNILQHDASHHSTPEGAILLKNDVDGKIMKKNRSKIPHREVSLIRGGLATVMTSSRGANTSGGSSYSKDRLRLQNMKRNILQEVNQSQNAEYQLKDPVLTPSSASAAIPMKVSNVNPPKTTLLSQGFSDFVRLSPPRCLSDGSRSSDSQTLQGSSQTSTLGYEDLLADQIANAVMVASPLLKESEICSHLSDSRYIDEVTDTSHSSVRDSLGPAPGSTRGSERRRGSRSGHARTLPLRDQSINCGPLCSTLDMEKSLQDDHPALDESSYGILSSTRRRKVRDNELLSVSGTGTPSSIHSDLSSRINEQSSIHSELSSRITEQDFAAYDLSSIHGRRDSLSSEVSSAEELTPRLDVCDDTSLDPFKFPSQATVRRANVQLTRDLISSVEGQAYTPTERRGGVVKNSAAVTDVRQKLLRFDSKEEISECSKTPFQAVVCEEVSDAWKTLMNTATPCLPVRKRPAVQRGVTVPPLMSYGSRLSPEGVPGVPVSQINSTADCRSESIARIRDTCKDNYGNLPQRSNNCQLDSPNFSSLDSVYRNTGNTSLREVNALNSSALNGQFDTKLYTNKHSNTESDSCTTDVRCSSRSSTHSDSADINSILQRYKNFKSASSDPSYREGSRENIAPELHNSSVISKLSEDRVAGSSSLVRNFTPVTDVKRHHVVDDRLYFSGIEDESFDDIHQMMMNLSTEDSPVAFKHSAGKDKSESSVISALSNSVSGDSVPTATLIDLS